MNSRRRSFRPTEAKEFRVRRDTIQGGFVDEPRRAVQEADSLAAGMMKRLAEVFADERAKRERPPAFGLGDAG